MAATIVASDTHKSTSHEIRTLLTARTKAIRVTTWAIIQAVTHTAEGCIMEALSTRPSNSDTTPRVRPQPRQGLWRIQRYKQVCGIRLPNKKISPSSAMCVCLISARRSKSNSVPMPIARMRLTILYHCCLQFVRVIEYHSERQFLFRLRVFLSILEVCLLINPGYLGQIKKVRLLLHRLQPLPR
jgi:hypothetical protein